MREIKNKMFLSINKQKLNSQLRRLPSLSYFFFKKVSINKPLYIYSKSFKILRVLLGLKIYIYNGRLFKMFLIKDYMIGFRFGEFIFTRRFGKGDLIHPNKKKKKKK